MTNNNKPFKTYDEESGDTIYMSSPPRMSSKRLLGHLMHCHDFPLDTLLHLDLILLDIAHEHEHREGLYDHSH